MRGPVTAFSFLIHKHWSYDYTDNVWSRAVRMALLFLEYNPEESQWQSGTIHLRDKGGGWGSDWEPAFFCVNKHWK